ncbi:hypothetical protein DYI25_13985 [Mesobacillus boroniphilus]|uniref:Uncharacterized protein n=1 Tax=Mesobacillus boroniphilus TaxID=308892 RepID=A0A944CPI4_9BACI|nr:hypothetical protein [Mesobacillus boroniphilus]
MGSLKKDDYVKQQQNAPHTLYEGRFFYFVKLAETPDQIGLHGEKQTNEIVKNFINKSIKQVHIVQTV